MKKLPWLGGVLSGFRLISHRPLAALFWAVAFALAGTIMAAFQDWSLGNLPPESGISTIAMKLSLIGLVLNLGVTVMVCSAILRASTLFTGTVCRPISRGVRDRHLPDA